MCFYDGGDCCDTRHKILPFFFFANFLFPLETLTTNVFFSSRCDSKCIFRCLNLQLQHENQEEKPIDYFSRRINLCERLKNDHNFYMFRLHVKLFLLFCIVSMCALVKSMIPIKLDMPWTKKPVVKYELKAGEKLR